MSLLKSNREREKQMNMHAWKCLCILIYALIDLNQSIFETLRFSYLLAIFSFHVDWILFYIVFPSCRNDFIEWNWMRIEVVIKWSEKIKNVWNLNWMSIMTCGQFDAFFSLFCIGCVNIEIQTILIMIFVQESERNKKSKTHGKLTRLSLHRFEVEWMHFVIQFEIFCNWKKKNTHIWFMRLIRVDFDTCNISELRFDYWIFHAVHCKHKR